MYLTDFLEETATDVVEVSDEEEWLRRGDDTELRVTATTVDLHLNGNSSQMRLSNQMRLRRVMAYGEVQVRDSSMDAHWKSLGWKRLGNVWRKSRMYRTVFNGARLRRWGFDFRMNSLVQQWVYKPGPDETVNNPDEWRLHGWTWIASLMEWWKYSHVSLQSDGGGRLIYFTCSEDWASEVWEALE